MRTFDGGNGLKGMASKYSSLSGTVRKSEERPATAVESVGVKLKGNSEQRRSGWCNKENKAARFECGCTDRYKETCPIWIAQGKRMAGLLATSQDQNLVRKGKGGKGQKKPPISLV